MTPKQVIKILTKFLGNKWTKGTAGTAIIGFLTYFGNDIKTVYDHAIEYKQTVDSVKIYKVKFEKEIRQIKNQVDWILLQQSTTIESLSSQIDDLDKRENEKDVILLEELDRVDSLGASLERTNPGNLYYYDDKGHFIRVVLDYKVNKWYYMNEGKRIYL